MRRVLIANRGEIAARILRTCEAMGLETVMVYSQADRGLPYLARAGRSVCIGPPAATLSYLSQDALLMTALGTGCEGVHPGYGFLAENAGFAARCVEHGLTFVGPDAEAIRLMGDKIAGREAAERHGVPVVPGCTVHEAGPGELRRAAEAVGFPLLIKASGGGGGRGMRVVQHVDEVSEQIEAAAREAQAAFSNPTVYLERFFPAVHHVEVQILGDRHGNVVHLGERDCSTQRRHQKLVEESPSPVIDARLREAMCADALRLAKGMGYTSAGTVEFIVDPASMQYYFIEMNTRIQVEHPVTEVIHGIDLIREQLRVAAGEAISEQTRAAQPSGHAIEWRINAEDPARGFTPSPGRISRFEIPAGEGVRIDTFVEDGHLMSPYYDSLVAKLVVHGRDRHDALVRSREALAALRVEGIATTVDFHRWLAAEADFVAGRVHTRWVEERYQGQGCTEV
jgi:acetyl-CoA carboxylase biotin carboxylase subunit